MEENKVNNIPLTSILTQTKNTSICSKKITIDYKINVYFIIPIDTGKIQKLYY